MCEGACCYTSVVNTIQGGICLLTTNSWDRLHLSLCHRIGYVAESE